MTTPKPLCIYHGGCADGFTAAWAVFKYFETEGGCDFHAGVYQDPPPDVTGRDVIIVDFSYKRAVLKEMRRTARSILVLDHHKSAAEDLAEGDGFADMNNFLPHGWGVQMYLVRRDFLRDEDRIYALFDMERSGAGIAWDFFHAGKPRPKLVDYVEDRDLWRFRLPNSREVNAFIFSQVYTFETWDRLSDTLQEDFNIAVQGGHAIERKHHKDVAELVAENAYTMKIGGIVVPVCNLPKTLTSDAGALMCNGLNGEFKPAFAACYWDTPEGRVFSLRSIGDFDVSAIAAQYGGGGHKNAAGFRLAHGVAP